MNKQIILAAVAGSASANVAEPCANEFTVKVGATLAKVTASLAAAEKAAATAAAALGTDKAKGAAWTARDKAASDESTHKSTVKTYLDKHQAAVDAEKANADKLAAAIKAKGAQQTEVTRLTNLIGTDTTAGTVKQRLKAQDDLITAQGKEVTTYTKAVTDHTAEEGAFKAAETALTAAVTAAKTAILASVDAEAALTYRKSTRAFQSPDGTGCTCRYQELGTKKKQAWEWNCTKDVGGLACTGFVAQNGATAATLTAWEGLEKVEENALKAWYGATGSRDGSGHSVKAGSIDANSKTKAYNDAVTAFDLTSGSEGEGSKRSKKRVEALNLQVKKALFSSGCVLNASAYSTLSSFTHTKAAGTQVTYTCGTNQAKAGNVDLNGSWDMTNAVKITDATILGLEKAAGGAFCNVKPLKGGADLTARNTARNTGAATDACKWSTAFDTAVKNVGDKLAEVKQAEWQWVALKGALDTNKADIAKETAKRVNAVVQGTAPNRTVSITIGKDNAGKAIASGALVQALDTANLALQVGEARTALAAQEKSQAVTNQGRAQKLLAALQAERVPIQAELAVLEWQRDDAGDKVNKAPAALLAKATADEKAAIALEQGLKDVVTAAALGKARAVDSTLYFTKLTTEAGLAYQDVVTADTDAKGLVTKLKADKKAAEASLAAEIAGCKGAAYRVAQAEIKAAAARAAAVADKAKKVKEEYDAASAFPPAVTTDGVTVAQEGSLCAIPIAADGTVGYRPVCKEGLCCGAAQKFLKDGTKLSVETCQKTAAHTFKYYPPLPKDAIVKPETELWRFQCVSAAQKLVAAATAALAASYMMA